MQVATCSTPPELVVEPLDRYIRVTNIIYHYQIGKCLRTGDKVAIKMVRNGIITKYVGRKQFTSKSAPRIHGS